jgi:hypothetical protein
VAFSLKKAPQLLHRNISGDPVLSLDAVDRTSSSVEISISAVSGVLLAPQALQLVASIPMNAPQLEQINSELSIARVSSSVRAFSKGSDINALLHDGHCDEVLSITSPQKGQRQIST